MNLDRCRSVFFTAGALLASSVTLRAQALVTWSASFDASHIGSGDSPTDFAYAGARAHVCGYSELATAPARYGAFVATFQSDGTPASSLLVDTPTHSYFFYAVAPHPAGGVVAVGERTTLDFQDSDALLWRIDASGAVLWSVVWDGPQHAFDSFLDVDVSAAGVIRVAGTTSGPPASEGPQGIALAFDAAGTELWSIVPEPTQFAIGATIRPLSGGDIAIASSSSVSRVSASGSVVWTTPIPIVMGAIAPGLFDDVFVVGNEPPAVGSKLTGPLHVQRIDSTGQVAWTTPIADVEHQRGVGTAITVLPTGRIVAAGIWTDGLFLPRDTQCVVASLDALGNLQWTHPIPSLGELPFELTGIDGAANGDVALAGRELGSGALFLTRIAPDGSRVWAASPPASSTPVIEVGVATDGNEVYVASARIGTSPSESDAVVMRFDSATLRFCFGDGQVAACPCDNVSSEISASGCKSSFGIGAKLDAQGSTSLANDTLALFATSMPPSSSLFFQGSAVTSGSVLGDGVTCTGGSLVRLGVHVNTAGGASFFPAPGELPISVRGGVTTPGERIYQTWYRNAQPFCTSATFNLTNAVRVLWVP